VKPLEGIRIVDITVAVAGPVATHVLGDMGAEVIKIEPPFGRPSKHLEAAPLVEGAPDRRYNRLLRFLDLNRSKLGMTLDLSKEAGRNVFLRLVAQSDVVIENMSPRVLPNLRLDFDELREANERIILVRMPAFGTWGPLRDFVSYGPGIDAMSGLSWLTGYEDGPPNKPGNYYCDQNAGLLAVVATLAALRHRDRTGRGQEVELSMLEGELQLVGEALLDYTMNGRVQHRTGNAHPSMSPHGVYPCKGDDAWVAIAVENDAQWSALCALMGQPRLAIDERFADVVSRVRERREIDRLVADWTRTLDKHDAERRLQAAGIPAGAALTVAELFADEQIQARGYFQTVQHPEAGPAPHARAAWTLSGTPSPLERHAPLFGEHNDYVLRELLGLSDDEIASLAEAHVISAEPIERGE
jgi:crotonobetainyl-CoA:carnitine CoA-transferase CaiB-like acyl-CoA transferase